MDALCRTSELHENLPPFSPDIPLKQHPEGVYPSLGAPVSTSTAHPTIPLTQFFHFTVSAVVSLSLR
jgi:hypothetical protein